MKWIAIDEEAGTQLTTQNGEKHTLAFGDVLAEDGTIQRDTGTGTLHYAGRAEGEEFDLFDFENYGFEASVEWDGSNHVLTETE